MQTTLSEDKITSTTSTSTSHTTRRRRRVDTSQEPPLSSSCIVSTSKNHDTKYSQRQHEEGMPELEVTESSKSSSLSSSSSTSSSSTSLSSFVEDDVDDEDDALAQQQGFLLHPTYTLPLLVMIDMLAVSLVIPLLMNYYESAGVTNANQREWLSSVFSSSQIVGGLVLGALADSGMIQERRSILILSFAGSAVSYIMLVQSKHNTTMLVLSRILVGLVKQTMTVCTTLLAQYTTHTDADTTTKDNHQSNNNNNNRAVHMGRLKASVTLAWIVGPTVGGLLYKHVHVQAPGIMAAILFGINMILTMLLLPRTMSKKEESTSLSLSETSKDRANHESLNQTSSSKLSSSSSSMEKEINDSNNKKTNKLSLLISNLQTCFASPALRSAIVSILLFTWFLQATDRGTTTAMGHSYYYNMYGLESHHRGYLSSYQSIVSLGIHSFVMGPWVKYVGGGDERYAATYAAVLLSIVLLFERQGHLYVYLSLILPLTSLSLAVMGTCLNTYITHVVKPKESLGSVLAALDVMKNVVTVTVPFYRTFLFAMLLPSQSTLYGTSTSSNHHNDNTTMTSMLPQMTMSNNGNQNDPDPQTWIILSSLHWFVAALALGILLLGPKSSLSSSSSSLSSSSKQQHQEQPQSRVQNDAAADDNNNNRNKVEKKEV